MSTSALQSRTAGGLEIAYRITGKGRPLILFHGAEGDHQIYDKLQDALGASVTAVSFDQRDCGMTRYANPGAYTLKDVAHDAVLLLDALGYERAHVLGNSIGGILAQLMAFHWPDRVDRLVLGLTWPADEQLQDLNPNGFARRAEYASMGEAGVRLTAEMMSSPAYVAAHPELLEDLKSLRTEPTPEARQRRQAAFGAPINVNPAGIRHQTLIIGGGVDQMVPAAVTQRLAVRIPRSRYEVLADAGHLAARQYPDALASLIKDFLHA